MVETMKKSRIRFCCTTSDSAKDVRVAGDFNNWSPIRMIKQRPGVYVASVTVPPGQYQYKFLIDGQWVADQQNPLTRANPFGTANSVCNVE